MNSHFLPATTSPYSLDRTSTSTSTSRHQRTPPLGSPRRRSPTPLLQDPKSANRTHPQGKMSSTEKSAASVDADALARALKDVKDVGRPRERTPGTSPSRKRQRIYGDRQVAVLSFTVQSHVGPVEVTGPAGLAGPERAEAPFIPNREGQDLQASFSLLHDDGSPATPSKAKKRTPQGELHFQKTEEANRTFSNLLRSEIFDTTIPQVTPPTLSPDPTLPPSTHSLNMHDSMISRTPPTLHQRHSTSSLPPTLSPSTPHKNLFTYMTPRHHTNVSGHMTPSRTPHPRTGPNLNTRSELYSLSPVRLDSQRMLLSPRKAPRAVSKVPYKVLDAPDLADDFYLNLVDWGSSNVLGVGLGSCVYMWNSQSGRVTKLCDLQDDMVTSVSWIQRGSHVSIGTHKGYVQIWDAERCRRMRTMTGHTARVGAMAWNDHILTSGSRDRLIYHRDVRSPDQYVRKLVGHKQEVCGLRWNCEDGQLASGGNDNKLMVWDKLSDQPLFKFGEHTAAVKAIAWSPHQHHLLASGGGTADRRIKFWNTSTGQMIQETDTGSQVCNLAWSKNSNEIVSTHGYSQNQIVVWKYPSMSQVVSLTGHTYRVLYLAMSPDGQVIVTGAGDETLRFWNCFKKKGAGGGGAGDGARGGRLDGWGMIR